MEETQFEALHVHINAPVANSDEHGDHSDVVATSLTSQAEESCFYAFGLHDILLQLALGHSLCSSQSAFASLPREVMYLDIARHVRALYMQDLSDRGFLTPVQMTMDYAGQTCPGAPRKVTTQSSSNSSTVSLDQPLVYYSFRERAAHSQSITVNVLQCLQHTESTAEQSQLGALPARGRGREESEGERGMDRGRGEGGSDASERGGALEEGRDRERESVPPKKVAFWWSPWNT
jgi:hypothetical protein